MISYSEVRATVSGTLADAPKVNAKNWSGGPERSFRPERYTVSFNFEAGVLTEPAVTVYGPQILKNGSTGKSVLKAGYGDNWLSNKRGEIPPWLLSTVDEARAHVLKEAGK